MLDQDDTNGDGLKKLSEMAAALKAQRAKVEALRKLEESLPEDAFEQCDSSRDSPVSRCGPLRISLLVLDVVPQFVISAMLLWALNPSNRYSYYIVLRWVCCIVFGGLAVKALGLRKYAWLVALGIAAVVYNPIIRVHLTRDIWSVVNVVTIGLALGSVFGLWSGWAERPTASTEPRE